MQKRGKKEGMKTPMAMMTKEKKHG